MYAAIVFLPLLAAIVAGFGARLLAPKSAGHSGDHGSGDHADAHDHGHDHGHDHAAVDAAHDHDDDHDDDHAHHGPLAPTFADRFAQVITCGAIIAAAVLGWIAFFDVAIGGNPQTVTVLRWIAIGSFEVNWALQFDTLSAVMIIVVTTVSACVHVYSVGYMADDPSKPRFMAYLSLFTFCMLMLVTSDNFVQMYFGWEGVGLASYLLIGFWYQKKSANAAAIKAFVVNRVGDFGFALGIMGVFLMFDGLTFAEVFQQAPSLADKTFTFLGFELHAMTTICLLLFIGAMGKSAQLGLHTWLPDAMEGPTPVSALIHAATMVTAGVFMICRLSPMFELAPTALDVVTVVGATTALFAATVGLTQTDIKRVIAYSTCSQLGYMFFAAGVGAYGAAMFHLMTHAFFKALLFLGAGSVIHAMHHEQDLRKMGGLAKLIPVTFGLMMVGNLALAGVWPFAGYYSKDMILEAAYGAHSAVGQYAFWLGLAGAFLTAFYSWRLIVLTFHGESRADKHTLAQVHESPMTMMIPLVVLAIGAVASGFGFYDYFVGDQRAAFWGASLYVTPGKDAIEAAHHVPGWVPWAPLIMGLIGIGAGYYAWLTRPGLPVAAARDLPGIYRFLLNKWYFDELYDRVFVRPSLWLGRVLWKGGDGAIIDGLGPNGVAAVAAALSRRASALQSGYVYHYAFAMLIGVVALVSWYLLTRNG